MKDDGQGRLHSSGAPRLRSSVKKGASERAPVSKRPKPSRASPRAEPTNSLNRMLGLLDLFTSATPVRPVNDLVQYIGTSRSTAYRYIKALHDAGLIQAVANGSYVLGPRIVELDRQIRFSDPMYRAGGPLLRHLVQKTGHSALLCALYSDSIMCIREELAPHSPRNLFSRGQRRPLFAGAASKIILPYLPPHRLRSIFARHQRTIAIAGLGSDWASFRKALAAIRRDGFVVTHSEFNPGVFGISAPIFNRARLALGSVGIAGAEEDFHREKLAALCRHVVEVARQVSASIAAAAPGLDRPPRAVG